MKIKWLFYLVIILIGCEHANPKVSSVELISTNNDQSLLFEKLMLITEKCIAPDLQNDSLAFLVLPVQASCPSCRKKVIDSIVKYQNNLPLNHYIVISAIGGKKTINSYFIEEDARLPVIPEKLFLDSTNTAYKFNLYDDKPVMYYSFNRMVFKKVSSIPLTVREDLHQFFSRNTAL